MDNFNDHLGDEKCLFLIYAYEFDTDSFDSFYNAYLLFFCDVLARKDVGSVLEEFIFSSKFNFGSKNGSGQHPEMLNRFLGGVIHPMIHTGYGVEFVIPGIIAEGSSVYFASQDITLKGYYAGLAQAAVHPATNTVLIPPSIFPNDCIPSVGKLTSLVDAVKLEDTTVSSRSTQALTILARIMRDPNMQMQEAADEQQMFAFLESRGEALFKYADSWTLDTSDPKVVQRKIEELQWMNVLIYAVAGFKDGKGDFSADFFLVSFAVFSKLQKLII